MATRVTCLDGPKGARAVRSPGFKVEKHNDGKSVRLSHVSVGLPAEKSDRRYEPSQGGARVNKLDAYSSALEQEGFIRIEFEGRTRIPGRVAIFQSPFSNGLAGRQASLSTPAGATVALQRLI